MAIIKPFRALRPLPDCVAKVAAVPYDVVDTEAARRLSAGNRLSFLHVSRPEIDLPDGTPIYSDQVYAKAAENFRQLTEEAPLVMEDEPSFYLYQLRLGKHEQTGIVACCSVDEYDQNLIRKHEGTRVQVEDDRTRHILAVQAHTGPVFLVYRSQKAIEERVVKGRQSAPLFDFTAPDGVTHRIWRVPAGDNQQFMEVFSPVPALYIADGHHRAKSASRVRETLKAQDPQADGTKEYDFFQCVIFPDKETQILAYNRVLTDLNGHTPEEVLRLLGADFEIVDGGSSSPKERGRVSMYLGNRWYGLQVKHHTVEGIPSAERLDVSVLQEKVIAPIFGIYDARTDKRIDFVGGVNSIADMKRRVDEGRAAVAFSLFPTGIDDMLSIADAGKFMPPKSTWFEPKLRDGILVHVF